MSFYSNRHKILFPRCRLQDLLHLAIAIATCTSIPPATVFTAANL